MLTSKQSSFAPTLLSLTSAVADSSPSSHDVDSPPPFKRAKTNANNPSPQQGRSSLPHHATISPIIPGLLPAYRRLNTTSLPLRYPDKFYSLSTSNPAESGIIALCAVHRPPPASRRHESQEKDTGRTVGAAEDDEENEGTLIGGIQARLEFLPEAGPQASKQPYPPSVTEPKGLALYIQTLATAPSHRETGVASSLLSALISKALALETAPLVDAALKDQTVQQSTPPKLPAASQHLSQIPSTAHESARSNDEGLRVHVVYAHVWENNPEALEWYKNRGFMVGNGGDKVEKYYWKLRPGGAWIVERRIGVGDWLDLRGSMEKDQSDS